MISLNVNSTIRAKMDNLAKSSGLSRTALVEVFFISHIYRNNIMPTPHELDDLRKNFPKNANSVISTAFRNEIGHLCPQAQFATIFLLSSVSAILDFMITTKRQANLHKRSDAICYFALGCIGANNTSIDAHVYKLNLNLSVLGPASQPANEYFFISNRQQFRIVNPPKPYTLYNDLCLLLGLSQSPNPDVVKIHYSMVEEFLSALEQL